MHGKEMKDIVALGARDVFIPSTVCIFTFQSKTPGVAWGKQKTNLRREGANASFCNNVLQYNNSCDRVNSKL